MDVLVYHRRANKAWEEVDDPDLDDTDAILRATTVCGTDLHILKGDLPAVTDSRILGHAYNPWKETSTMQENDIDRGQARKGPAVPSIPTSTSDGQLRATTAAKDARIKVAGLGGNRVGEVSATVKRAQAHRDAATEATPETDQPPQESLDAHLPREPSIQVQVNANKGIHGSEKLNLYVQDTVHASLGRFDGQVTRVEVHLSDDNGDKSHGDDKRCLLEARPAGHQPLVVTHIGATLDDAVEGAVDMMEKLLDSTFERLHDPKGSTSLGEDMTL